IQALQISENKIIKTKMLSRACFRQFSASIRRMSSTNIVETNIDSGTGFATVTLSQPPVNSLDKNLLTAITDRFKKLSDDSSVTGAILTSKFDGKVFSAGLNIVDMFQKSDDHLGEFWGMVQEWYLTIQGFPKPLVSAINGHAPTGGCAMALMSDYRVMVEGKTIGLNETLLGIVAPFFFADLMIAAVGRRHAEFALNNGYLYTSDEALKIGLVDEVVNLDQVVPTALKILTKMTKTPQPAYQVCKNFLRKETMDTLRNDRAGDIAHFVGFVQQPNVQKAIGGYLQALKQRKK
uniref:Enoyl-CoA delta isomerase 1, mitochondrial n=1 Tax=Ciona intestinalis TaxID=7719 RepID=H2XSH7_CIOIN